MLDNENTLDSENSFDNDLVRMVNQISDFFSSYEDEEAAALTAKHLRDFWDLKMRRKIVDLAQSDSTGLSDISRRALMLL